MTYICVVAAAANFVVAGLQQGFESALWCDACRHYWQVLCFLYLSSVRVLAPSLPTFTLMWVRSSQAPSGSYEFATTYMSGENMVLVARTDPSLNMSARAHLQVLHDECYCTGSECVTLPRCLQATQALLLRGQGQFQNQAGASPSVQVPYPLSLATWY